MMRFFTRRMHSVTIAARGIADMLRSQHNAWVHALATLAVLLVGWCLGIDRGEWCWIVLATVSVWTAEALNTSLELIADATVPEFHPLVQRAKDVAAGAVLLSAIGSVVIAILVFGPYVLFWFGDRASS